MDKSNRKRVFRSCKGPHLKLWLWFLMIECSLCLQGTFANCKAQFNLSLTVQPEGNRNLQYGDPLELYCVDDIYGADKIEFFLGLDSKPSEKVNDTARRLYTFPEKGVFSYFCRNKETKRNCVSRVFVDGPPQNVTDFDCKSKNLDELTCTWTVSPSYSQTNYSLRFIVNGQAVESCQAVKVGLHIYSCTWSTNSKPRYRQLHKTFFFNMNISNVFGSIEQNFTVNHYPIVQPDPVSGLKIIKNGTHSVVLQWQIPNNMADLMPQGVVHKIEYQIAKIDNTSYFRNVNTSRLPRKNKNITFQLSDLPYAHMQYEVRIYIRPTEATSDKFWSKHAFILFYTDGEKPHRPPDTVAGAFHQSAFDIPRKRTIYVYWKQLEEYEEAGANFTYKVIAYEHLKNSQTKYAETMKRSYVILDPASLGPIDIQIWSKNDNGLSTNSSHLYIPPLEDTESLSVPSFTKLAYGNGTYKLAWGGIDNINNYTLFWCQHNATKICTGRMNFTIINPAHTEHVINLPEEERYQFAISANSGDKTSGMVWATCDIFKDGIQMYGFPVKLDHDVPGKSFVKITWTMACTLREGIITGYLLSYCPVKDTSSNCVNEKQSSSVYISDTKQMHMNITDLKPHRTYLFSLSLNTTYGLKKIENASTSVTTTEDTPSEPRNVTISDIQYDSISIAWDPPLDQNGIIGKYEIYNYSNKYYIDNVPENDKNTLRRNVTLSGLEPFQNYSWSIIACNTGIQSCSQHSPSRGIVVRTRIGPPSKLRSPTIINNPDAIKWEVPEKPGGTVDLYEIKLTKDDQITIVWNTTKLCYPIPHCEGAVAMEKYQVRAVNFDEDINHGTWSVSDLNEVVLPVRKETARLLFPGEWSEPSTVACKSRDGLTMTFILIAVFGLAGVMYGSTKYYKKYRKMEDIKPVLPYGLGVPEKEESKYAFDVYPSNKDEKPSSDEMLLLPDSRGSTVSTNTKQKDDANCGSSDHTDSTALSDVSGATVNRQPSNSDDGSNSSLHLEIEAIKADAVHSSHDKEASHSDSEPSRENSPYLSNRNIRINPTSGYVQQPVVSPVSGYVQSAPAPPPVKSAPTQLATSSYVMAALSPPIFTTGVSPHGVPGNPPPSSGYVRPEDAHLSRSMLNFTNPSLAPTKLLGPESLPIMPTLPPAVKPSADNSYIQLQSLDSLPIHKAGRSVPTPKPAAASGYVSPADAVINKHLNNMLSSHLSEESAMIDPTMSPDAYCRFSWSKDPANDNLHSLLADSPTIKSSKN